MFVIGSYLAAFIGGAVVWHFYATKILGYAKQAADQIKAKV